VRASDQLVGLMKIQWHPASFAASKATTHWLAAN
jgi:hypothetical protein